MLITGARKKINIANQIDDDNDVPVPVPVVTAV